MLKIQHLILFFLCLNFVAKSQVLDWQISSKSKTNNRSNFLEVGKDGCSYLASESSDSTNFVSDTLYSTAANIHFYKLDKNGSKLWRKDFKSNSNISSSGLSLDNNGNIYLIGNTGLDTVFIDGQAFIPNDTMNNSFISKFNKNGILLYFKFFSGNRNYFHDIKTDNNGNIYLTGSYEKTLILGDTILPITQYQSSPFPMFARSFFISKFDNNGNLLRVNVVKSNTFGWNAGTLNCIELDSYGNVYAGGTFRDSIKINNQWTRSSGNSDMILIKLTNNLNFKWLKTDYSPSSGTIINGINIDNANDIYISGKCYNHTKFDSIIINPNSSGFGYGDAFLVKYNTNGNTLWAKNIGTSTYVCEGNKIAIASTNQIYWTGSYANNAANADTTLTVPGSLSYNTNTFIFEISPSGNFIKAFTLNSDYQINPRDIEIYKNDTLFVLGLYRQNMMYQNTVLASQNPINNGETFLAKFSLQSNLIDNCFANYITSYNALSNTFNINVDSTTSLIASSYLWDFGDGSLSNQSYPTHIYNKDSVYNVCMKIYTFSGDSCTYCHVLGKDTSGNIVTKNSSSGFSINVINAGNTTGLNSNNLSSEISLYPNPTNSETKIYISEKTNNVAIKVFDTRGIEIYKKTNLSGSFFNIDISNQPSGVYFIELLTEKFLYKGKIIKY